MPITRIGICAPMSSTKSKLPGTDERIQAARTEFADLGLQGADLARGEHARQQLAVDVVDRRVLENQHARRDLDIRLDQLQDRTAGRDEGPSRRSAASTSANRLSA